MSTNLSVELRTGLGKGAARKIRAAGKVPAVLYADGAAAVHVTVDPTRLLEIFRKSQNSNTVLELSVGGETVSALVKETLRHPVSRALLHVDFYKLSDGKSVVVDVPIKVSGKAAGAALGGRIEILRRTVKARAAIDAIPEAFTLDVTPLEISGVIMASEIPSTDKVKVLFERDFKVVACLPKLKG